MPYKSARQARFMRMCLHNPSAAKGQCPPRKVLKEFESAEQAKRRRGSPKFH